MKITKALVTKAKNKQIWDLGNQTLYDLCEKHPAHTGDEVITAKIWLIGRAYAAAIERRKSKNGFKGDAYYIKRVVPKIKKSDIDELLSSLDNIARVDLENIDKVLRVHYEVVRLFKNISGDKSRKRSLASKYLHFHKPQLFFIYDSKAKKALGKLKGITKKSSPSKLKADDEYSKFCEKCMKVRDHIISSKHCKSLTPRELGCGLNRRAINV